MEVQVHIEHEGRTVPKRIEPKDYDKWTLQDLLENKVVFRFDSAEEMRDEINDLLDSDSDSKDHAEIRGQRNGMQMMYDLLSATENWK